MDFAALLAPIGIEQFKTTYFGRQPLHIPAGMEPRKRPIDWQRLSDLLSVISHWTPGTLALILNSRPILTDFFMDEMITTTGQMRYADPAKVETFLAMGASLVGNDVEKIDPVLRQITHAIGNDLAALTNANVYCSFKGVQGFATHFDLHEVFAVQCEGEKTWAIYENRADNPVEVLAAGGEEAQRQIDAARGPVAMTVRMRPGDVLYLPRGVYHDARTEDGASLHVTFSAAPHSGLMALKLLSAAAVADREVRSYLPDGRNDPTALKAHLELLATRLAAIVVSKGYVDQVIDAQRSRFIKAHTVRLPAPPVLVSYMRTAQWAEVRRTPEGAMLVTTNTQIALGLAFAPAEYIMSRPAFSAQELSARFAYVPETDQAALIAALVKVGVIKLYSPTVA